VSFAAGVGPVDEQKGGNFIHGEEACEFVAGLFVLDTAGSAAWNAAWNAARDARTPQETGVFAIIGAFSALTQQVLLKT